MIPWSDEFDHIAARVLFGRNELSLAWPLGKPMPEDLPDDIAKALEEVVTTNDTAPTAEQVGGSSKAVEQSGEHPEEGIVAESNSNTEDAAEAAAEPQQSDSELATGSASSNSDNKLLHSGTKLAPLHGGTKLAPR